MKSEEYKRRDNDVVSLMTWIIRIGSTLAAVGVIFGTIVWGADTRYAQRTEVQAIVQQAVDGLRKSSVEDKIFEINLVPPETRTNAQRALLDRSLREAGELKSKKP